MQQRDGGRRPNIVFVFSDQHRARTTGFGGARVHTPVMDRMAAEGVGFDTAVSNIPVCTPWRAALLTGQYPLTNGLFLNDLRLPTDRPTLGTILGAAGYATAYIGKWHLDGNRRAAFTPPGPRRQGFQFWAVGNCTHDYLSSLYYRDSPEPRYWDGYDAAAQTAMVIDYVKARDRDRPFALVLSWGPPHNPYRDLPRRYLERYPPAAVEVLPNCPDPVREDLAGYYAHVTALDEQLGRLEAALAAEGLLEDTIFVYTSDHGDMLGSQGVQRKQHPWDESILVPFLLRCPGQAGRGRRISFPLNVVDILPTLLGLAGVPIPATVEGRDLSPAVRGDPFAGNESALTMCIAPFAEYVGAPWRRAHRALQLRPLARRPRHPLRHAGRPGSAPQPLRAARLARPQGRPGGTPAAAPGATRRPLPARRRLPGTVRLRRRRARRHSLHELSAHRRVPSGHRVRETPAKLRPGTRACRSR